MKLTQLVTFASVKFYGLITLISDIAQLLLIYKFYCFCPDPLGCLMIGEVSLEI